MASSTPLVMDEDKMKRAFNLFDKDGDGKISQTELAEVMKTLGRPASAAELRQMIGGSVEGMFTDRGGAIEFETFKKIVVRDRPAPRPRASDQMTRPVAAHTKNLVLVCMCSQNGEIKGGSGELGSEITDLQEAFKLLDKEGKGYIGAEELVKVCKKLGEDLSLEEADEMVAEALIGYSGQIYYDGLLKILITQ